MGQFRALVQNNPNHARLDVRTFGAWGYDEVDLGSHETIELVYRDITGPLLKTLGGDQGDNDGIVPYASSVRPRAITIFSGKPDTRTEVNHAQIRKRVNYWKHVQAQLLTASWDNSPSPPANVVAQLSQTSTDVGNVTLTWENRSRFATLLRVERSVNGGAFTDVSGPVPIHYPVYVDLGVTAGSTYAYRLRYSVADRWTSAPSNVASVYFPPSVPNAPTQLTASALSSTASAR
jgi:hypothetical protein